MQTVELFNQTKRLIEVQIDHVLGCKVVGQCHCRNNRMATLYLAPDTATECSAVVLELPLIKGLLATGAILQRPARPVGAASGAVQQQQPAPKTSGRRAAKGKE